MARQSTLPPQHINNLSVHIALVVRLLMISLMSSARVRVHVCNVHIHATEGGMPIKHTCTPVAWPTRDQSWRLQIFVR